MKYLKHLKVVLFHKYFVLVECWKRGMYWQGIVHDLSKFSPTEFIQSAKYFQGKRSPIAEAKDLAGYSAAWLHHKGVNKHHWEYWTDFYDGEIKPIEIPLKYLDEVVCDMIGASKAYLKGKYSPSEPLEYFLKNSPNWCMKNMDKTYIEARLRELIRK